MNYEESIAFIHGKAGKGVKVGLENMRRLMRRLGDPQKPIAVHPCGGDKRQGVHLCAD